jgi:hypothetical protein
MRHTEAFGCITGADHAGSGFSPQFRIILVASGFSLSTNRFSFERRLKPAATSDHRTQAKACGYTVARSTAKNSARTIAVAPQILSGPNA